MAAIRLRRTWRDIVPSQHSPADLHNRLPRQPGKLAEQLPVEAKVQAEPFGHSKNELPVRNPCTDVLGDVDRGDQRAFLVTGRADAPASGGLTGERHEELVTAVGTPDTGKPFARIAGVEKMQDCRADHGTPEPVSALEEAARHLAR